MSKRLAIGGPTARYVPHLQESRTSKMGELWVNGKRVEIAHIIRVSRQAMALWQASTSYFESLPWHRRKVDTVR